MSTTEESRPKRNESLIWNYPFLCKICAQSLFQGSFWNISKFCTQTITCHESIFRHSLFLKVLSWMHYFWHAKFFKKTLQWSQQVKNKCTEKMRVMHSTFKCPRLPRFGISGPRGICYFLMLNIAQQGFFTKFWNDLTKFYFESNQVLTS